MEKGRKKKGLGLFLLSPLLDHRIPAPNVKGVFADYQIRKHQLDEVADEVDKNWPGVCGICVGVMSSRPSFFIDLDPFSEELQRQHWQLADRIESIIGNNNCYYFFLPRIEENLYSSDIRIYKRE